jgi:hypothetical protein
MRDNPEVRQSTVWPRSTEQIESIVCFARLHLYNKGLPCGAAALRRYLRREMDLSPLPSVGRIGKILTLYGLTHRRTGWYEGEELHWLPASAHVPEAQRRHFSMYGPYEQ